MSFGANKESFINENDMTGLVKSIKDTESKLLELRGESTKIESEI